MERQWLLAVSLAFCMTFNWNIDIVLLYYCELLYGDLAEVDQIDRFIKKITRDSSCSKYYKLDSRRAVVRRPFH